eukprot:TRINITY_DN28375_c0_g1_i1.p1 TRINITY_DN28375_c0_g1~~TRINITY_DN28375_c0_g1_i1.p1  ORF type:complete len:710 (+),score=62.96 TRINITY_DN28375_c0_g1_i1:135-2264(+)
MCSSCVISLHELFSPLSDKERDEIDQVYVDESVYFHNTLHDFRRCVLRTVRNVPIRARLTVEIALLILVLTLMVALVSLHAIVMPTPSEASNALPLVAPLVEEFQRLRAANISVELLRIHARSPIVQGESSAAAIVQCEFASERAMLELPTSLRERAYMASNGVIGLAVSAPLSNEWRAALHYVPLSLQHCVLYRMILAAVVWGPLVEDSRMQEAKHVAALGRMVGGRETSGNNTSQGNVTASAAPARAKDDNGIALQFLSCQGQAPMSMRPLFRAAALLRYSSEWRIFKLVWVVGVSVIALVLGTISSWAIRSSLRVTLCLCLGQRKAYDLPAQRSEAQTRLPGRIEAAVVIFGPVIVAAASMVMAGERSTDLLFVFACQALAELASLGLLRTEESRYVFPRALLPVYVANLYYVCFHPFGFTFLAHGVLCSYQAFLLTFLCGHFETEAHVSDTCPDRLHVLLELIPAEASVFENAQIHAKGLLVSSRVQHLIADQSLLLLGDDKSYEAGVATSAIVSRAAQVARFPLAPHRIAATNFRDEAAAAAGGPVVQSLLSFAQSGHVGCRAVFSQILERFDIGVPASVSSGVPGRCTFQVMEPAGTRASSSNAGHDSSQVGSRASADRRREVTVTFEGPDGQLTSAYIRNLAARNGTLRAEDDSLSGSLSDSGSFSESGSSYSRHTDENDDIAARTAAAFRRARAVANEDRT